MPLPLHHDERADYASDMNLTAFGCSDIGRVRRRNEDAFIVRPDIGLFAVADGMGGHVAGDVASRIALDAVAASLTIAPNDEETVAAAIRLANLAVWERGEAERDKSGMGTTLTTLAFVPGRDSYIIGHVGDTRVYRVRAGNVEQLTRDHTAAQQMVDSGQLSKEKARRHPLASMLQRSIGTRVEVDVDVARGAVEPGDLFLVCSDGLSGMMEEAEMAAMLQEGTDLEQLCRELIDAANQRGGVDNITAVLVKAAV
jgi:serine/threonine protein phosphatase PrpC